jgi:hypothetical protein
MGPLVTGTFSDGTFCDGAFCDESFSVGSLCTVGVPSIRRERYKTGA